MTFSMDVFQRALLYLHFYNKIESVQCNSVLAITACIRGTSKEKLCCGVGLRSHYDQRWYHHLLFLLEDYKWVSPCVSQCFIPNVISNLHNTRGHRERWIPTRTLKFRYIFPQLY